MASPAAMPLPRLISGLSQIAPDHDALICDVWGVVHDGSALYPGVAETLSVLQKMNKPVLFLSNAPRVSARYMVRGLLTIWQPP